VAAAGLREAPVDQLGERAGVTAKMDRPFVAGLIQINARWLAWLLTASLVFRACGRGRWRSTR
jgi:hypothetical protein